MVKPQCWLVEIPTRAQDIVVPVRVAISRLKIWLFFMFLFIPFSSMLRHMASLRGDADGLEGLPSGSIASDSSTSSTSSEVDIAHQNMGEKRGSIHLSHLVAPCCAFLASGTKGSYNQHKSESWINGCNH